MFSIPQRGANEFFSLLVRHFCLRRLRPDGNSKNSVWSGQFGFVRTDWKKELDNEICERRVSLFYAHMRVLARSQLETDTSSLLTCHTCLCSAAAQRLLCWSKLLEMRKTFSSIQKIPLELRPVTKHSQPRYCLRALPRLAHMPVEQFISKKKKSEMWCLQINFCSLLSCEIHLLSSDNS